MSGWTLLPSQQNLQDTLENYLNMLVVIIYEEGIEKLDPQHDKYLNFHCDYIQ